MAGLKKMALMLEFGQRRPELRAIFMGTPEFAIPCLEHLILDGYEVAAVYTQPDKPAGRGRLPVSPPVKRAAEAFKLPVVQPVSLRNSDAAAELAGFHPDVIVVTAFGQILPQAVLDIPRRGCINVHFSLLPRFRGASPVSAAILAGDEFTGVSIMLMDSGLDTGPCFRQRYCLNYFELLSLPLRITRRPGMEGTNPPPDIHGRQMPVNLAPPLGD